MGRRARMGLLLRCLAVMGALGAAAGASLAGAASALAREVIVQGSVPDRYGRILLAFDEPTKVKIQSANGVLVIAFGKPTRIKVEKLVAELPGYVSVVRRDPDETGLRLALIGPVRTNVLEAGEKVFVDLLPPRWVGLPPGLPPEVVAELAERAREAEEKLKAAGVARVEPPRPVALRLAQSARLTRLVFEPPAGTTFRVKQAGSAAELVFDGRLTLDEGGTKPRIADGVRALEAAPGAGSLTVKLAAASGYDLNAFAEEGTLVVDLSRPGPPEPAAVLTPEPPVPPTRPAAAAVLIPIAVEPRQASAPPGAATARAPLVAAPPAGKPRPALEPTATVLPRVELSPDGPGVVFPFAAKTPAAAFERGPNLTLVFDARERIDPAPLATGIGAALRFDGMVAEEGFAALRFSRVGEGRARLVEDGTGWRLTIGHPGLLPPDAVRVSRAADETGQPAVRVELPGAASARWLTEPDGARIAVVTASGRNQGMPTTRSFVEFALAPTLHGIVVEARSDDLKVALGEGGALVSRQAGLTLSSAFRDGREGGDGPALVLGRELWSREANGPVLPRYRELVAASANAPRSARAEARTRLAKFLLANELNHEAAGVLDLARAEDTVFARSREALILSGIAAARTDRFKDAHGFLADDVVAREPEAQLWRAVVELKEKRPGPALVGLRRANDVIDAYPETLAGEIRLAALRAALDLNDVGRAQFEWTAIGRLPAGSIGRDDHDLARARIDEASGRGEDALASYTRLGAENFGRIGAEARLRSIVLRLRGGALKPEEAVKELELLSVAWRGDAVEAATTTELARLYGRLGRWRDMFALARIANRYFGDDPGVRSLSDEVMRQFEALMLGPESEKMSAVDTLALYFDFRYLAPPGRRGDEIVRRLSDKLVELDLLEQAGELLQHQVDKRLVGAARSTIAARLAAVRLMAGKPVLALAALHSTRLPELPEDVRRFRTLLEAKAQADLTRTDLALEVLDGETGPEAERMRAHVLWAARRWREAGETGEQLLGTRWSEPAPLTDRERAEVIRAGVAYLLAEDRIGADRLGQKFGPKMADSPDAKAFAALVAPGAGDSREFRRIAAQVAKSDALRELLDDWRAAHPDAGPELSGADAARPARTGGAPAPTDRSNG
ncbi:MAG: hypothetical protein JO048_13630 [Methylobacteriaceae bacterium]|nr:hypothetical protein [Methylobacteriaceae bacterium]